MKLECCSSHVWAKAKEQCAFRFEPTIGPELWQRQSTPPGPNRTQSHDILLARFLQLIEPVLDDDQFVRSDLPDVPNHQDPLTVW
jgi:hypothetical protein